jgi:hypothetical protein
VWASFLLLWYSCSSFSHLPFINHSSLAFFISSVASLHSSSYHLFLNVFVPSSFSISCFLCTRFKMAHTYFSVFIVTVLICSCYWDIPSFLWIHVSAVFVKLITLLWWCFFHVWYVRYIVNQWISSSEIYGLSLVPFSWCVCSFIVNPITLLLKFRENSHFAGFIQGEELWCPIIKFHLKVLPQTVTWNESEINSCVSYRIR